MSIPAEFASPFAAFPESLRKLVEAELADGNSIVEICGGFPAAPCGDCLKLAKPVAASRRQSRDDVHFYERNNSNYNGEFTHDKRHFFVLEPPQPEQPEPDMDAIRAEQEARELAADANCFAMEAVALKLARRRTRQAGADADAAARSFFDSKTPGLLTTQAGSQETWPDMDAIRAEMEARQRAADADRFGQEQMEWEIARDAALKNEAQQQQVSELTAGAAPVGTIARFVASMEGIGNNWRDGIGYDVRLLKSAMPHEIAVIESLLLIHGVNDWRDVEALAAIDSEGARKRLREALKDGVPLITFAIAQHAPDLVSDAERTKSLVDALERSEIYGGLTQALLQAEDFHPPEVIAALLRGALARSGEAAVHFAAMLMFVYGAAQSSFDWKHRPLFLRFNTEDRAEREAAFRELCKKIGVPAQTYLDQAAPRTKPRAG